MKKLLVALALLTVSTIVVAEDRYRVLLGDTLKNSKHKPIVIVDTWTGDIAYCGIKNCIVNNVTWDETNFKRAFEKDYKINPYNQKRGE